MEYSILDKVDRVIKEEGIAFDKIIINYSYLSKYINQAILNNLRKITGNYYLELGPEEYTIKYDCDGTIYMEVIAMNKHTRMIISNDKRVKIDYSATFVRERDIMEEAFSLLLADKYRSRIKKNIRKYSFDEKNSIMLENDIVKDIGYELRDNISDEDGIRYGYSFIKELDNSFIKIKEYIDYVNEIYKDSIKDTIMNGIYYIEPNKDHGGRYRINIGNSYSKERCNPIMGVDERLVVLEKYPYIYREYAFTESSKKITYLNYLYQIDINKYILIMEPYNGVKYTKMVVIEEDNMNKEIFNDLIREYLELSDLEFISRKDTVRSSHTSMETFENVICHVLTGEDTKLVNPSFKKKIKDIKRG